MLVLDIFFLVLRIVSPVTHVEPKYVSRIRRICILVANCSTDSRKSIAFWASVRAEFVRMFVLVGKFRKSVSMAADYETRVSADIVADCCTAKH